MCDEDDEEAVVFECGASLAASAFPNFDEIRRAGKLCDVVLTASGFRYDSYIHKTLSLFLIHFYLFFLREFFFNSKIIGIIISKFKRYNLHC